jgi:hypothetical protein
LILQHVAADLSAPAIEGDALPALASTKAPPPPTKVWLLSYQVERVVGMPFPSHGNGKTSFQCLQGNGGNK